METYKLVNYKSLSGTNAPQTHNSDYLRGGRQEKVNKKNMFYFFIKERSIMY